MKKNIYRILGTAFAMALVAASPTATITSHAQGFNFNAPEHFDGDGRRPSGGGSSDSGASSSDSGSSSSGSSNSGSSYGGGLGFNADAPEHYDGDGRRPGDAWDEVKKNPNDLTVGVTGGQKFRIVMSADHTTYQVYHCGIDRASFKVTDAEGNAVAYKTVALEQGEDNLWYANISFGEGADTTGYTVAVTKGDANYLGTELNVSGIKINGTLVLSTVPATEEK